MKTGITAALDGMEDGEDSDLEVDANCSDSEDEEFDEYIELDEWYYVHSIYCTPDTVWPI